MESEEFMLLPANQLIDIISSDELNVRSEEQVFNAVMAWVKYSIQCFVLEETKCTCLVEMK
jgi:kelch-like protein 20